MSAPDSGAYAALPLCPNGCECRVGSDDPDRHDCGCDGPCTAWMGEVVRYVHPDDLADESGDEAPPACRYRGTTYGTCVDGDPCCKACLHADGHTSVSSEQGPQQ